jgi:hypothetical protein
LTRSRAGDEAVSSDGGNKASDGNDSRVRLHCVCWWMDGF